jgi:hypothetical protein
LEGFEMSKGSFILKETFTPDPKEFNMSVTACYLLYWQGIKGFKKPDFYDLISMNQPLGDIWMSTSILRFIDVFLSESGKRG